MIEDGFCKCGCGENPPLATRNRRDRGWIKGQPLRYAYGHQARGKLNGNWKGGVIQDPVGYVWVHFIEHPKANSCGYIKRATIVAEGILGKPLPDKAVVHHVNGIKSDDAPTNILICENHAYHRLIHIRQKAFKECGDAKKRRCYICKKYDEIESLYNGGAYYHMSCKVEYQRNKRIEKCMNGRSHT